MTVAGYARWIDRRRWSVVAVALALSLGAGWLIAKLPVEADLSYMLPPSAESVRQLRAIEARARVLGTVMVAVVSDDPQRRATAARALRDRFTHLAPDLVSNVTFDDAVARRFTWDHRWQLAPLDDLVSARDGLREELRRAHLRANPLYVDLDDEPPKDLRGLRDRLRDAERAAREPAELVGKDGRTQLLVLRTDHAVGDLDRDRRLVDEVGAAIAAVRAEVGRVEIGMAGDVVLTLAERDAIQEGMIVALAATVGLVLVGLLVYFRSAVAVGALSLALLAGTLLTFGFAKVAVGHLNLATAFLSSIVVGNGINFGIVLVARYLEALRAGEHGVAALTTAIAGTRAGTLVAALAAAIAYGSLTLTAFRGFRDFGIIAGVGIALCWIAAYTLLPALLAIAGRAGLVRGGREPAIARILARLAPRRTRWYLPALALLAALTGVATWRYLADEPFESDFRRLRSTTPAIESQNHWMAVVDQAFGQGISGGFVIAVGDRRDAAPLVARLRALDAGRSETAKLFSRVGSLDDLVPPDQTQKLALLAELRGMLTDGAIAELDPRDAADARALRPPADLVPIRDADVPEEMAWPFTEADGSRGRVVLAMQGWGYNLWSARDAVRFAQEVRGLDLGPGVLLGGEAFVFADMLELVNHDGPIATLASAIGALLLVLVLVGHRRHGLVTIACGAVGTLGMIALAALLGLRVNFLDFVALPITIGIGIDYAANIAARARHDPALDAHGLLGGIGSAVLMCSYTTIVGYAALLLSRNQGIRSFGTAAILGEATCLLAALVFVPVLVVSAKDRA